MRKFRPLAQFWLALTAVVASTAAAQTDPLAAGRAEFLAAYARVGTTVPEPPADSEALRAYPLYPYLVANRLEARLADPGAAPEIEAFLREQGDAPVARSLRRSWLMTLAVREDWEGYLASFRKDVDDTEAARCEALAARVALGRVEGLAADVTETWLSPKSVPSACDSAFEWLRSQGKLGPDLVERRARLALDAGEPRLARYLAKSLPDPQAAPLVQWASLIEQPRRSIDELISDPTRAVEPQALLDGWRRLARSDPEAAAERLPALAQARSLDASAASPYALAVALSLSWSRHPRSLEFFALVQPQDFDERAHEWRVRAALWAGDWSTARDALAAMPDTMREQNRWRYWSARAAEQLGDRDAARAGYEAVLPTDNWYAALAAGRMKRRYAPTPVPLPRDAARLASVAAEPPMVRTRELLLCDLPYQANAEWSAALDGLDRDGQIQAVHLASGWGWYLQAIAAAAKLGLFDDYELFYPRPYDHEVRIATQRSGLPPSLIYAVIRQESLYRADAASSAGARGLMQLLPSTAKLTARRAGLPAPSQAALLQPEVNVPLGSMYLRGLLDRTGGQLPLAIASYNAGPAAVARWIPAAPMETDVWVENIPYNETRSYVQRVHWHSLVFAWLTDRRAQDVSSWLQPVRPAAPEEDATAAADPS